MAFVTLPSASFTNCTLAGTTRHSNSFSDWAKIGNFGCPVIWANSDSPSRVTVSGSMPPEWKMSAGATAPEAGQIAKNLAQDIRDADEVDAAKESDKSEEGR